MPPQVILVFVLAAVLILAWLASEFQPHRWLRVLLGILALSMSIFLAQAFALIQRLNFNIWYGQASKNLIEATIVEIETGQTEDLLPKLRNLRDEFGPTYENRDHYDRLVEGFVSKVSARDSDQ